MDKHEIRTITETFVFGKRFSESVYYDDEYHSGSHYWIVDGKMVGDSAVSQRLDNRRLNVLNCIKTREDSKQ